MNKESLFINDQLERLRLEMDILMVDTSDGLYDPVERLRKRKIDQVTKKIIFYMDSDGIDAAMDGYEGYESGKVGKRLGQLERNP